LFASSRLHFDSGSLFARGGLNELLGDAHVALEVLGDVNRVLGLKICRHHQLLSVARHQADSQH
jgi:hypothetical protein